MSSGTCFPEGTSAEHIANTIVSHCPVFDPLDVRVDSPPCVAIMRHMDFALAVSGETGMLRERQIPEARQ